MGYKYLKLWHQVVYCDRGSRAQRDETRVNRRNTETAAVIFSKTEAPVWSLTALRSWRHITLSQHHALQQTCPSSRVATYRTLKKKPLGDVVRCVFFISQLLFLLSDKQNYTGCPGRNVPDFGRMFLKLKYNDITKTPTSEVERLRR